LGDIHQVAAALYCIRSLQSVSLLPESEVLNVQSSMLTQQLNLLVDQTISSPQTRIFILWPLVVLGAEALNGGVAMRAFVEKSLQNMSHHIGSYAPIVAGAVLARFWASGEKYWDACFDRPYVFLAQTAVDVSGITIP